MTRKQFIDQARRLLTNMEFDHEEHTGLDEDHQMSFADWMQEISNAQENTSG